MPNIFNAPSKLVLLSVIIVTLQPSTDKNSGNLNLNLWGA